MAFNRSAVKDSHVIFGGKPVAVSKLTDAQLRSALTTNARNAGALAPGWQISGGQITRTPTPATPRPTASSPAPAAPKAPTPKPVAPGQQPTKAQPGGGQYLNVMQKQPNGRFKLVAVHRSKLTPAQVQAALKSPHNQGAKAGGGWGATSGGAAGGNAAGGGSGASGGMSPEAQEAADAEAAKAAYLTDPWYQSEKARLDYERAQAKGEYDQEYGTDGTDGRLGQDWKHAINVLTRNTRNTTSETNAGLSGANLAGSGVAKKSLSDIGAEFLSTKSEYDRDFERGRHDITKAWQDFNTMYNSDDLASKSKAVERWKERNAGVTFESTNPTAPTNKLGKATAPKGMTWSKKPGGGFSLGPKAGPKGIKKVGGKMKAPPGMQFVKNPRTGKFQLKPMGAR